MSAARRLLERLLRRAESARRRGIDEPASLPLGNAAEYRTLRTLEELETFHAQIALAERDGAVSAERERAGGDGSRLLRLHVRDARKLARHLGLHLAEDAAAQAQQQLENVLPRFPVLERVIAAWRQGGKVRGGDACVAAEFADAALLILAREADAGHERILRRESVRLFGDSKRIEALWPWLEILLTDELAPTGLSREQAWAQIGLRREPQPMLLAGHGKVQLDGAETTLVRPYLGLPVEAMRGVATDAAYVLSIENLASFHDAARMPEAASGLLIYTGGMPSPAWRAAYERILASLARELPVYHWGDIDEGGYRIAAVLGRSVAAAGRRLRPWSMSPCTLPAIVLRDANLPSRESLAAMCRWAGLAGWPEVAAELAEHPVQLEQEVLAPCFPEGVSAS